MRRKQERCFWGYNLARLDGRRGECDVVRSMSGVCISSSLRRFYSDVRYDGGQIQG